MSSIHNSDDPAAPHSGAAASAIWPTHWGDGTEDLALSHIGLATSALDVAVREVGFLFGDRYREHAIEHEWICPLRAPGMTEVRGRSRWMIDARPMVEIIEETPSSHALLWKLDGNVELRLDHVAFWANDLTAAVGRLTDAGYALESSMPPTEPGLVRGFAYLRSPSGLRVELQPASDQPALSRFLGGGPLQLDWGF